MVIPDVNVLIHASREDTAQPDSALAWPTAKLGDTGDDVVVPDLIWVGLARFATHPRFFASSPLPLG
ncbi:MAG: hypothetical protein LBV00_01240 [Propionibacteriaceae bacterium]|jgi:predicted nucleic acid-binding protein|nr:hypothetical protein [Propionibacteriaceae bacterium]